MHACLRGRGALISWRSNGYGSAGLILRSVRDGIDDTRHAAVLSFLSLPRYHFGFSEMVSRRKRALNYGLDALFTHVVPSKPGVCHEIERSAEMLAALGGNPARIHNLELWLSDSDRFYARQSLAKNGVMARQPLICLGIGATQAKRRWPIERFSALAQWPAGTYGARILVVGDTVDACNAEYMRPILGPAMINQAGVCTVRQSAALLSFCHAFIGNDSGPMHLAAASDVPVIELSCHPQTAPQGNIKSAAPICTLVGMGTRDAAGASFRRVPNRVQ